MQYAPNIISNQKNHKNHISDNKNKLIYYSKWH